MPQSKVLPESVTNKKYPGCHNQKYCQGDLQTKVQPGSVNINSTARDATIKSTASGYRKWVRQLKLLQRIVTIKSNVIECNKQKFIQGMPQSIVLPVSATITSNPGSVTNKRTVREYRNQKKL